MSSAQSDRKILRKLQFSGFFRVNHRNLVKNKK